MCSFTEVTCGSITSLRFSDIPSIVVNFLIWVYAMQLFILFRCGVLDLNTKSTPTVTFIYKVKYILQFRSKRKESLHRYKHVWKWIQWKTSHELRISEFWFQADFGFHLIFSRLQFLSLWVMTTLGNKELFRRGHIS